MMMDFTEKHKQWKYFIKLETKKLSETLHVTWRIYFMQKRKKITFKSESVIIIYYILDKLSTNTNLKAKISLTFSEARE